MPSRKVHWVVASLNGVRWNENSKVYINYGPKAYVVLSGPDQYQDLGAGILHVNGFPYETVLKMDTVCSIQIKRGQE